LLAAIFRFLLFLQGFTLDPEPVPHDGRGQGFWRLAAAVRHPRATVENTLFEDSDQSNTFKAFEPTQEEETYSMVTAHVFWSQIFDCVLTSAGCTSSCCFVPVMGLWTSSIGIIGLGAEPACV